MILIARPRSFSRHWENVYYTIFSLINCPWIFFPFFFVRGKGTRRVQNVSLMFARRVLHNTSNVCFPKVTGIHHAKQR